MPTVFRRRLCSQETKCKQNTALAIEMCWIKDPNTLKAQLSAQLDGAR